MESISIRQCTPSSPVRLCKMKWLGVIFALVARAVTEEEASLPAPDGFIHYPQTFFDRIHLAWYAPNVTEPFFGYKLDYYPKERPEEAKHTTYHRNTTNVIVDNLRGHTEYVFRLQAMRQNKTGLEGNPTEINLLTIDARPPKPKLLHVTALDTGGVEVVWEAPTKHFEGQIEGYEITLRPEGDGNSHIVRTDTTKESDIVTGLRHKTTYFVTVKARSGSGTGEASDPLIVTTTEAEEDNTSLAIIMSCAIVIPVVLIVLFILLYIYVLRPALASPPQDDEALPEGNKSDVKLTDLSVTNGSNGRLAVGNPLSNSEKPPVVE